MVADPREPADGIGWAIANRADDTPIYCVVVVLGSTNVLKAVPALKRLKKIIQPVEEAELGEGKV